MKTTNLQAKIFQFRYILLVSFLAVVFFKIAISIINPVGYPNSDFFSFWLSGKLAAIGQNPYDTQVWVSGHHHFNATWISDATFLYPLPLAVLFIPFGLLPLYDAFVVWDVLTQLMIVLAVIFLMIANSDQSFKHFLLPVFAGVILFRPTILTVLNGQLSGMLLLIISATMYYWEKGKWIQGAFLLAVLALKPNLGIPIIGLVSVYLILQKQVSSLIGLIVSGVLLVLVGLAQDPNWITEFWNVGNTKLSQTFGISPTIWGISTFFCNFAPNCTVGYGTCVSLLFIIGFLYLLIKKRNILSPSLAVGLAVALTLLLTPYTWSYDQLLLVAPIVTIAMLLARDGYKYFPVSLLFLAIDIFAFLLLGIAAKIRLDIWNASIPLLIFCLLVWYLSKNKRELSGVEVS
jgi:hypothetical protein